MFASDCSISSKKTRSSRQINHGGQIGELLLLLETCNAQQKCLRCEACSAKIPVRAITCRHSRVAKSRSNVIINRRFMLSMIEYRLGLRSSTIDIDCLDTVIDCDHRLSNIGVDCDHRSSNTNSDHRTSASIIGYRSSLFHFCPQRRSIVYRTKGYKNRKLMRIELTEVA